MTFILFTSRILRTLFKCPFDFGLLYVNNFLCFDISSSFDMLPVVLFLLALISMEPSALRLFSPFSFL